MRTPRGRSWPSGGRLAGLGALGLTAALAATLVALPPGDDGGGTGAARGGDTVPVAAPARAEADNCDDQSLPPSDEDGPTIEEIKNRKVKKLVVGVDQNSFRWGYRDPNKKGGQLEGFDIDLARKIAEEIFDDRDAVVFRAIPTNERIPAIKDGRVDMVVRTMTVNCERLKDVDFSSGYFKTGQQVLAPRKSDITGYNGSLKGKKVCSAAGSIAEDELKKQSYGADISTTVPNQLDCLVRLQLGEVDAVVTDSALAAGQAAQDPAVELKGEKPFTTEYYGVAMKKGADDLVRRVNKVLADYRADKDGWKKSYDEWLRGPIGENASPPKADYRD
ncbi:sugar-binding protein [Streptomyces alfalfae]|uniref:Sugar-binding protein n=1 Tax=Streptomyces alfalfae TaxID=1642299 RepID=A0ABM6GX48_9ACTN|nr:glutamate ABC transporter substrate-binding protein [Streptomyces alfalfae]AYA18691.1 glutamate ABC transporter substrate-binding protein [Streptomyces fradiae]APY88291.1 sugar-binding protein [Streptomyces alfalfae]QUI31793.1 glutamate ABC transporter substrate-binding protein [Streptomyces alfalfae]RXX46430.1 sugar-binding protein [Streptomyces alfalfae]RZM92735.1 glutamate ABC transporter substrate-binding protein [Streptomyces alfalfae]